MTYFYNDKKNQLNLTSLLTINQVESTCSSVLSESKIDYHKQPECFIGYSQQYDSFAVALFTDVRTDWLVIPNFHNWMFLTANNVAVVFRKILASFLSARISRAMYHSNMLATFVVAETNYQRQMLLFNNQTISYMNNRLATVRQSDTDTLALTA